MIQNKFLISYLGGSGGDFFCSSCNGIIQNNNMEKISMDNKSSLKSLEQRGMDFVTITKVINGMNYKFINTHLFEEFLNSKIPLVSLIFRQDKIKEKIILRQMQLQKLKLKVAPNENVFNTLKSLCIKNKYDKAAKFYFEFSKRSWIHKHERRIFYKNKTYKNLYFDEIFSHGFCFSLMKQGWNVNLQILKRNHIKWLKKNSKESFSYDRTIDCMAYKFSQMPWHKEQGWIEYMD